MLVPPTKGFGRSIKVHNVEVHSLVEWIEGSVTFFDAQLSRIDIVDVLIEEQYYSDQSFAEERLGDAWVELRRRERCLGECCPYEVGNTDVRRRVDWKKSEIYAFCLMLSLQVSYRASFKSLNSAGYGVQGKLFERLTAEALEVIGWKTLLTAWSDENTVSFPDRVAAVGAHLSEPIYDGGIQEWASSSANDGGLDVVCHLPFTDQWSGRPVLFVQCASGENWTDKTHSESIHLWRKLLDLATVPCGAIAIPFALSKKEFRHAANCDRLVLILDRHRLCNPRDGAALSWISAALKKDLNKWTKARLVALQLNELS